MGICSSDIGQRYGEMSKEDMEQCYEKMTLRCVSKIGKNILRHEEDRKTYFGYPAKSLAKIYTRQRL